MCDGMACQHCICSICCSAGLLWQPAHPRSLALLPPHPSPHLSYARTNHLFIWMAIFPLSLTVSGGRWGKAAGSSAPMLVPCSPAEEASEGEHTAPSKSALCRWPRRLTNGVAPQTRFHEVRPLHAICSGPRAGAVLALRRKPGLRWRLRISLLS